MESVSTFIKHSTNHFSPSFFLFHFPSLSHENRKFLNISNKKRSQLPGICSFKISEAAVQSIYGGWDDLKPIGDSAQPGESNHLRNFLVSIGIDDAKQIYMFLLGICCALAISRVRVKSSMVFPAFILVFGIGFALGFLGSGGDNGRRYGELVVNKRRGGETVLRNYNETLMKFLDDFEVKLSNLKDHVQKAIGMNKITVDELKSYTDLIVSMRLSCLDAKKIVDVAVAGVGHSNGVLAENQKSSRKKKELGDDGFGLFPFVRSLFGEVLVILESNKVKDKGIVANNQTQESISTPAFQKTSVNLVDENNANQNKQLNYSQGSSNGCFINMGVNARIKMDIENKEYSYRHKELEFISDNSFNSKIDRNGLDDKMESHDSLDFRISSGRIEKEAAYMMVQKQILSNYNEENETYTSRFREILNVENNSILDNNISDDVAFDRCLAEANDLLNKAKEYITAKHDEDNAEIVLHKSAKLLSKAVIMKPKSLLAVGQLGNTYLLHGELKLKITRQLRGMLSSTDSFGKTFKGFEDHLASKENVASVLVNVCEECEELLVEAGRKYKLALSIDGDDVRALYNWGLALSFRAQLIADIGPEAAFDADRIFLAATDKFDAMISKGNAYASEALFRWGMTLQQRSRLRPITSKERLKLLQQAKRLYEDSLHEDSNNFPVKEALASCMSELKRIRF